MASVTSAFGESTWTIRRPLAANADDARLIADAARAGDVVDMEAFHWRYHPFAQQVRDVVESGVLGRIDRIDAAFDIPDGAIARDDIRWDLPLGGGATMDLGCYPIQWVRWAAGSDPDVVSAEAVCPVDGVERHFVIGILVAGEGELLGGERVWASERCLRLMMGDALYAELEPMPEGAT